MELTTFYVSTEGNDGWSGTLAEPNSDNTDGPFATLERPRDATCGASGQVCVWVKGGRYQISQPIEFGSDSNSPITYQAYPGEQPIIDGGRRISEWRVEKLGELIAWVVDIPEVAEGMWYFRQLFVNGERRARPRLPKEGFHTIESVPGIDLSAELFDGSDTFVVRTGDIREWHNLTDVEVIAVHWWVEERMPIKSFDPATGTVTSSRRSIFALKDDRCEHYARYYVENVFEALTEPGEWYLDRTSGRLYYLPLPGETIEATEVYAPVVTQFVRIAGCSELRFKELTFRHADWIQPLTRAGVEEDAALPDVEYASAAQAAANVPGAIYMENACGCAVEDCHIEHIGYYGIELSDGCKGNRIVGNEIYDAGAGGIKLNGSDTNGPIDRRTGDNRITDNHINACGRVFHSAAGILSMHSYGNQIRHNHIHDIFYTGISCGWVWAYTDNVSRNNRIEKNHIHDIGQGLLSDMGGIYTLGVQPGTVLVGNLIHDICACNYGGFAIYLDQSSSYLLVRDNICFNTSSQVYYQNTVRPNIVRNNIFAFGAMALIGIASGEMEDDYEIRDFLTLDRNILITDGKPVIICFTDELLDATGLFSDLNLLWDVSGAPLTSGYFDTGSSHDNWRLQEPMDIEAWRKLLHDRHSIVGDPQFEDISGFNWTMADNSPALDIDFRPIDMSDVGPRPKEKRS